MHIFCLPHSDPKCFIVSFSACALYKLIMSVHLPACDPGDYFLQGAAERTPRFGRGIAWGGERVVGTAVYVPFSVYTIAWLGEHRAFIVEEFIKNGG